MSSRDQNWIANYIWGIADDVLRDLCARQVPDVTLPMTVPRRLDAVLQGSKQVVLGMKSSLDGAGVVEQDTALRQAAGQAFYNTSGFTLRDLRTRANRRQLNADFTAYLDGFSANVQDILDNFEFRNQIPRLSRADALGTLIKKITSPDINLSSDSVHNADGSVKHPGLDHHGMGTIFEELVRRFNEENNEEAGEHWTRRAAVRLMAKLVFQPIADQITFGTIEKRLAGGDRRPAAQHVLQHRQCQLRVGAHQPQAVVSARQGAVDRRHRLAPAAAQEPGKEELRTGRGGHRPHLRHLPRLRGDRAEQDLR